MFGSCRTSFITPKALHVGSAGGVNRLEGKGTASVVSGLGLVMGDRASWTEVSEAPLGRRRLYGPGVS